jgi:hypothetical protein
VLAQTLAHIWRASKHEEEAVLRALFAQNERIPNGWSGLGACKRVLRSHIAVYSLSQFTACFAIKAKERNKWNVPTKKVQTKQIC